MVNNAFGEVLRSLRRERGWSLAALASRANYSAPAISRIEQGHRPATPEFARACDHALGTTPLLAMIVDLKDADPVKRRAFVTTATLAAAGTVTAAGSVAELVRQLIASDAARTPVDGVIEDFSTRYVTLPDQAFQADLMAALTLLRERARDGEQEANRGVAALASLHGMWLGNQGATRFADAHRWHSTAAQVADRTGDVELRTLTRGRHAMRAPYHGGSLRQTRDLIEATEAVGTTAATWGMLEAQAAKVHVCALAGDLAGGRRALGKMSDLADRLPVTGPDQRGPRWFPSTAGPAQRVALFRTFHECRTGGKRPDRVYDEMRSTLAFVPLWRIDASMYYYRRLVTDGHVQEALSLALAELRQCPPGVSMHVFDIATRDLVQAVPGGHRSAELDELRTLASPTPGPWETVVA